MKPTLVSLLLSVAVGALAFNPAAHAGTIVNIKGFSDGVSAGSGVDNPGTPVGFGLHFTNAVQLQLQAGDYTITDAWGKAGALYDAWDFENGAGGSWTNHFSVGSYIDGEPNYATYTLLVDGLPGTGTGHYGGFDTEAEASAAFLAFAPITLHLDQDTLVGFAAPDYDLEDNSGGISLEIDRVGSTTAVPEPANVALLLSGLAAVASLARRRARNRA